MQTTELLERRVFERLHANGDAVNAGRAIAAKPRSFNARWVGFEGNFRVDRYGPDLRYRIDDGFHRWRLHKRGRAAAEENGRHESMRHPSGGCLELGGKCAREPHLVDGRMANMTVEIAIRAFRQAKQAVNIHPQRRLFFRNAIFQSKTPP